MILEGAVTVVAVEEAEVGLAAGKIHNYTIVFGSEARREKTDFAVEWVALCL